MVVISTDPWEDQSSSKPEQPRETEIEKKEETLFGFQDLASDYYQVKFPGLKIAAMSLHAFYGEGGGPRPPPFIFQRGGLFEKRGGAKFFRPSIAAKTNFKSYRHFSYAC